MVTTVRPATEADIARILLLWKEFMEDPDSIDRPIPTHDENLSRQREFVQKLIDEDPKQVQVAEDSGKLVGYIMGQKLVKSPMEMPYKWGFVSDLFVEVEYRGKGIGERLLSAFLNYLKSSGIDSVRLAVWHKNVRATNLYKKAGFKERLDILQADL